MRALFGLILLWIAALPVRADPLADTIRVMTATPAAPGVVDLAAHQETAGHWQLANRAGARFTASLRAVGSTDEITRAVTVLAPELSSNGARLVLHLSETTGFAAAADDVRSGLTHFKPAMRVVIGNKTYPALTQPPWPNIKTDKRERPQSRTVIGIRPGIGVEARELATFRATEQHLTRAYPKSAIRIVAFDPAAPAVLPATPRFDPQTKEALVDAVAPAHANAAISALKGQMVIVSGRLEPGKLLTKAAGAAEETIDVDKLVRAAADADIAFVLLDTGSAAQPGGRNLLWLPVVVPGFAKAGDQPSLADVLFLASGRRALRIVAGDDNGRLLLRVTREDEAPAQSEPSSPFGTFKLGRWADKLTDVASDLIGRAPARAMIVSLPSPARQAELDRRLIKSVPSWLQYGYAAVLLLGLLGAPTAWQWFARIWPQEQASEYANAAGFHAARAVRTAVFAVVFMPLAAMLAAPAQLLRLVRRPA